MLAVTGEGFSYAQLEDYVKAIRKELNLVSGVARVELWGVPAPGGRVPRMSRILLRISSQTCGRRSAQYSVLISTLMIESPAWE